MTDFQLRPPPAHDDKMFTRTGRRKAANLWAALCAKHRQTAKSGKPGYVDNEDGEIWRTLKPFVLQLFSAKLS